MLEIVDSGERNIVKIDPESQASLRGRIVLTGSDNSIRIASGCSSTDGLYVELGSSCSITIDPRCTLGALFVYGARDAHVQVGADSGFNGSVRLLMHEPGRIDIGYGCLFAGETDLSISDMHSLVDVDTGRRINPPADIRVGDRVWLGQRANVLKGAQLGDGCVVGAGSIVRGTLPTNTVCAGVPAKVVRTGVTWRFDLLPLDGDEPKAARRNGAEATAPVADGPATVEVILPAEGLRATFAKFRRRPL
ncbi:MAG TPA: acyltransferase [Jatrophihabitantaceae bacterium]